MELVAILVAGAVLVGVIGAAVGIGVSKRNAVAKECAAALQEYEDATNSVLRWFVERHLLGYQEKDYIFAQSSAKEVAERWKRAEEAYRPWRCR